MADMRFQSIHLEGSSRRDLFRQARERIKGSCGDVTINGDDLVERPSDRSGSDATRATPKPGTCYCLKEGEHTYKLVIGVNSIGRLPDNAVVLADDHVSRRHCAVVVHSNGRCELHDIASKNGTLLNGKKLIGPTEMTLGDEITLCGKLLQLCEEQANKSKSKVA